MNLETVKELVALMKENALVELYYEEKDVRIRLKKEGAVAPVPNITMAQAPVPQMIQQPAAAAAPGETKVEKLTIKSPMVGTYYSSQSPDSKPFVSVGDTIKENDVICILEAMKVMNEIKADLGGVVKEVLVQSGEPVEYGQDLFVIEQA